MKPLTVLASFLSIVGSALFSAAQTDAPVLHIEKVLIFRGDIFGLLPMPDGKLIVSFHEYGFDSPQVCVLDARGNVLQRVDLGNDAKMNFMPVPLPDGSLVASIATPLPDVRVVRILPDGSHDPAGPISPRSSVVLPFPGGKALVYDSLDDYPNLPGNPFDIYELRPAENGSRLERLPMQFSPEDIGRKPRVVAVTASGAVWAFLAPVGADGNTLGTLTRFLPEGGRDPNFKPAAPITDAGLWCDSCDWIAPTPDGGIYLYLRDGPLRHYGADGQQDTMFVWNPSLFPGSKRPAAALPDGGVILPPLLESEVYENFRRLRRDGTMDPAWASEITDWSRGAEGAGQCHVADQSGALWILHSGFKVGVTSFYRRITRLLPDGRRDPAFSDHRLALAPLEGVRVTAEIRAPNERWRGEGMGQGVLSGFVSSDITASPALHPMAVPRRLLFYEAPVADVRRRDIQSIFFRLVLDPP